MAGDTVPDIGGRDVSKEYAAARKRAMERHPTNHEIAAALRAPDQHPVYSEAAREPRWGADHLWQRDDEQLMQPTPTPITAAPPVVATPHGETKHRIVTCVVFETFCREDQVAQIQSEVLRHVHLSVSARAQAYAPAPDTRVANECINGGYWREVQERDHWDKAGVSN